MPAAGEAYKFVLCTSVNSEIVHGMPNPRRVLKKGDIVSIDTGVKLDGYYGDSALTVPIGEVSEQTKKLLAGNPGSRWNWPSIRCGRGIGCLTCAVRWKQHVKSNGFSIVREYVGHGIGTQLHEEPQVPNYVDRKNENPRLKEGMVLAVEPMVNAGQAGSGGAEGQVDGRHEGRLLFRALRALHRGDRERAVGVNASVVEERPNAIYVVELANRQKVLAHLVGVVERNFVRLVPGDRVEVELSPHDPTRGRITKKL